MCGSNVCVCVCVCVSQLLQAQADAEGRSVRFPCVVLLDPSQCSKEEVDQELEEAIGRTLGRVSVHTHTHTGTKKRSTQRRKNQSGVCVCGSKVCVCVYVCVCVCVRVSQDVVTRTGSSLDPTDLQRVSAGDAGTVIVTCPSAGADTGKVRDCMHRNTHTGYKTGPHACMHGGIIKQGEDLF